MKHISLLIKPASGLCNLRCRYCFYDDVSDKRAVKSTGMMTIDTAETMIRTAFAEVERGGSINFAFQGGEPTMAGLNFFGAFVARVADCARDDVTVNYSIQTNGILVDEEWASFFKTHRFLVGLSLDGTKDIHDLHRTDPSGRGTWNRAVKTLRLLTRLEVDVNILCVVTAQAARSPQKIYHALQRLGVRYIQFIPCLDPLGEPRGEHFHSLTPDAYQNFLCGMFDLWYLDFKRGNYISIRLFDDYIHLMLGLPPGTCAASGQCGSYLVVEGDGGLYPCDFYVLDDWRLGSVTECTLAEAAECERSAQFQEDGRIRPDACVNCRWRPLCRGGCKRDRHVIDDTIANYYCTAFRAFFEYAFIRLAEISRLEARARGMHI